MNDLLLLSERQMAPISLHFPLSHGVPRVDDRRVVSGIVYVIKHGLQWKDAPRGYGPQGLRPAQDALQPLHPLEPARGLRSHLRRSGRGRDQAGSTGAVEIELDVAVWMRATSRLPRGKSGV